MSCCWNISAYCSGSSDARNSFQFQRITVSDHCPSGPFSSVYSHGMIGTSASAERSNTLSSHAPVSLRSDDTYRMDLSAELALRIASLVPPAQDTRMSNNSRCNMAAAVQDRRGTALSGNINGDSTTKLLCKPCGILMFHDKACVLTNGYCTLRRV